MEIIKKYNNRKLYSTKISKYVDLAYILDLVKTNQRFQVIENKTETDITSREMKKALSLLPMDQSLMEILIRGSK